MVPELALVDSNRQSTVVIVLLLDDIDWSHAGLSPILTTASITDKHTIA